MHFSSSLIPSLQPIQPAIHPVNMPLTPDLSPMSAPFLPFQPKPKELKPDRGDSVNPVLLSPLPRHFVGGSLGGFSPIKGVCPLDVFRNRISLQRGPESPALTPQDQTQHHPTIYTLQPKSGSPDTPHPIGDQIQPQSHPLHQHHNHCTGCNVDDGAQRGASRDVRNRPPLPPLRVLPLNLDCSVQVCQLMRTRRLDSSQLQTFTRRLSEALSQDLSTKPPCSPMTPPPEQALPLNLSKRFMAKRPNTERQEPSQATMNGNIDQPPSKKARTSSTEQAEDFTLGARSNTGGSGGGQDVEMKNQEEPADLSSPSRIRAFLLGLPPFQVKLEEDLNGTRFGKFVPPGSEAETQRTVTEKTEGGVVVKKEVKEEEVAEMELEQEERDATHCSGPDPAVQHALKHWHTVFSIIISVYWHFMIRKLSGGLICWFWNPESCIHCGVGFGCRMTTQVKSWTNGAGMFLFFIFENTFSFVSRFVSQVILFCCLFVFSLWFLMASLIGLCGSRNTVMTITNQFLFLSLLISVSLR